MRKTLASQNLIKAGCEFCGKTAKSGNKVSHSQRKTKRQFKANLQKVTIELFGTPEQIILCGKCIKKLKE